MTEYHVSPQLPHAPVARINFGNSYLENVLAKDLQNVKESVHRQVYGPSRTLYAGEAPTTPGPQHRVAATTNDSIRSLSHQTFLAAMENNRTLLLYFSPSKSAQEPDSVLTWRQNEGFDWVAVPELPLDLRVRVCIGAAYCSNDLEIFTRTEILTH